jgi:hypothetical protein
VEVSNETVSISSHKAKISIDGADIFIIEGLNIGRIESNEEIKLERANSEGFILPWNKTW